MIWAHRDGAVVDHLQSFSDFTVQNLSSDWPDWHKLTTGDSIGPAAPHQVTVHSTTFSRDLSKDTLVVLSSREYNK